MKRLSSTDSPGALMSICPTTEEGSQGNNPVYNTEFQSILEGLDEEDCVQEMGLASGKKRRLRLDQVEALEKSFEVENKLEPERKVKLAQELGLQPRQVAVWFQNRRARWKTKQLENKYGVVKASYDSLQLDYENLQQENQSILKEINALKSKLDEENIHKDCDSTAKEEVIVTGNCEKASEGDLKSLPLQGEEVDFKFFDQLSNNGMATTVDLTKFFTNFKDGSSDDSDSSAVLNEDNNSPKAAAISPYHASDEVLIQSPQFMPSAMNYFPYGSIASSNTKLVFGDATNSCYQPQGVKIEEHNFCGEDESCNFFSDPGLQWYCRDQWR